MQRIHYKNGRYFHLEPSEIHQSREAFPLKRLAGDLAGDLAGPGRATQKHLFWPGASPFLLT